MTQQYIDIQKFQEYSLLSSIPITLEEIKESNLRTGFSEKFIAETISSESIGIC